MHRAKGSLGAGIQQGFTLVEVVVALAVLSLVMLTTVTGFRTLGNTAGTLNTMTDRIDEMRSVSSFLRDAMENSVVGGESGGSSGLTVGGYQTQTPVAFFRVRDEAVEWRSKVLFGEAYGGSYFLRLAQKDDELVLQWQEPEGNLEPDDWSESPSRTVLSGVDTFEIAHRSQPEADWLVNEPTDEAPSMVRLVIAAGGKFWPDLIMRVQR
ncbi:general secretion pathway protein J, putative [Luminiphilus syltensis NOR5-1B]|uniref:General secretion pathway protein J, putative n=1 Tax=Luminiphilus syltensis NOR5-1B TaxID=565045 RepID=B8KWY6_9GAMM|nr:prepilin-type N-terminal cleavage/methylation domain-containing protein [Luminiphilus syltensis]EED35055.1 general secretion pathway protein J, putative [Luminiphilus syltensis NOR5-1B]